ncbi:hypothetical protein BC629DRAFT_1594262 [Irpex lacteus]|nr:hypothetical protein BC629DRAFT_1594262 [Irpex lacteus]
MDTRGPNEKARMRRSPPPLPRIRGILVSISDYTAITEDRYADFTFPDLTLLRTNIEEHCSLRVVAFVFDSRELLLAAAKQCSSLLQPMPHGKTYVLACKTSVRRLWDQRSRRLYDTYTEMNRTSMEPTGTVWTAEEPGDIVTDILDS